VTPGQTSSVGVPRDLARLADVSGYTIQEVSNSPEDLEDLINLRITGEEGLPRAHFSENAPHRPHVNAGRILTTAEQDLRGAVPEGDDLVGVGAKGDAEGAGETEIGELEVSILVNKKVLGLEVAVKNTVGVAVADAVAELPHELLDDRWAEAEAGEVLGGAVRESLATAAILDGEGLHVLLEVEVEELEDEVELVAVGVDDIEEADDVWVLELLEEGDLANGGGGDAFIFGLETNLLQGNDAAAIEEVAGLVDDTVGTCRVIVSKSCAMCQGRSGATVAHLHRSSPTSGSSP